MMMKRSQMMILSTGLLWASCSSDTAPVQVNVSSKAAVKTDTPVGADGEEKITLVALDSSAATPKAFLQSPDMKWALSDTALSLSKPDGTSLIYDRTSKEWGAVEKFPDANSYKALYAFHDGSFSGMQTGILGFRKGTGKLLSYDTSKVLTDANKVLGLSPGFFAAALSDGIMIVQGDGTKANAVKVKEAPASMIEVGSCVSGCLFWSYDGQSIYTFSNDNLWKKQDLPFSLPENKKVTRYTMALSLEAGGAIKVSSVAALTEDGALYLSSNNTHSNQAVTFEQVKKVTTTYCVSCHSGDAFELETGLKNKKSEILKRLALETSNALVMPPKTASKALPASDKSILVSWLTLQTQGVDNAPTVPTPTTPAVDNATVAVIGSLATQGGKYCVSCHPTAKFKAFWIDAKGDIASRVESGAMPKGKTMEATEKADLLKALDELKE